MSGVVVRDLDWEDYGELGLIADTITGRYWMEPDDLQRASWQLRLITILHEEEAQFILARGQVSAHTDFASRILSSINPTSATDLGEVTEALAWAMEDEQDARDLLAEIDASLKGDQQ